MLHFVIGKPRSGKSYWATANQKGGCALVRELMNADGRYVVTNLPLVIHELEEFLAKRGKRIDCSKRVTLLEHEQVRQFWRYRGGGYVREVPDDPKEKAELRLLQNEEIFESTKDPMHKRGVLYILDEVHVYYPARGCMQKTGDWVFQYATQHGHFTDTIMMITQSLSYVDKQFREMTQDYTYMENERLRKVKGFRKGSGFIARTFIFPPTLGTEEPDFVEEMPLDTEGYGAIYDTSGGAGISGGGAADKGAKVKGLPLKAVWFIGGLSFLGATAGLFGAKQMFDRWIMRRLGGVGIARVVAPKTEGAGGNAGLDERSQDVLRLDRSSRVAGPSTADTQHQDNPPSVPQSVTWTRYVDREGRSVVYLSDGRVITSPSRVEYDATGVVDVIDLEGKHWRLSRAPMAWASVGALPEKAEVKR